MIRIDDPVVTGQLLDDRLGDGTGATGGVEPEVEICPRAKLTPSAQDFLKAHNVRVVRREATPAAAAAAGSAPVETAPRSVLPAAPSSAAATRSATPSSGGSKKAFKGIFCPNSVIFDAEGKINYAEMERYIEWLIQAGIHGLYPNGSTGEFVRLSWEERQDVVRLVAEVNQDRVPILAGASEANLRDVLRMAEFCAKVGAHAISLVPPFYYKVSDRSLFEYLAELGRDSPLDILLYNIPQFTQELTLDIMEDLLPFERIVGTKDSSRDLPRLINTMHRMRAQRPDYVVLVGCEEILCPSVLMGASGGTIATSGIIPEVIVDIYEKSLANDVQAARALQYRILDLINLMLLGVNFPEGFKTGVAARGFDVGPPRQVMSEEERQYLLNLEAQITCILSDMGYSVQGPRACPVTDLSPIVGR